MQIQLGRDPLPPVNRRPGQIAVLDVTKWFGETSGGVRTYLEQKSAYVATRPWLRHVLVIPSRRDRVTEKPQARWYHIRGPRIPTQRQYRFLLAIRSLRRIVEHERPDIIEVGSPIFVPWIAALAARRTHTPLVSFYHTNIVALARTQGWAGRARGAALTAYARKLDRLFATTLVASDCAGRDLERAGITRTIRVPLGVDLDMFAPWRREHAAQTKTRLGASPDKKLVVFAGRMAPEKSLDVAIEAWRNESIRRSADFVIVGEGPLGPDLRVQAAGLPIHFLPFESERARLADVLSAADVYLAPGSVETFGLSALEAMACGTPVVSANRGGVAELVTRSGAGALFSTGDAASLAAQLDVCLSVPALGERARTFVECEHGWDTVFDRIFDAYRSVLADRPVLAA
jgi:alpha-1,6-mannosyltransferase